jgi:hypothetical protein
MRIQWLAAMAVALAGVGAVQAQPQKPPEPSLELRVRSVSDLLDKAEYLGGLAGKEDVVQTVKGILKGLTKEKTGLEGVDPKRPFGLVANLSVDVVNSPAIFMIPIASEERFLQMLKDRLEIVPEKDEDGTLKAFVPVVEKLYLRFANDYLYIARSVKELDPKTLISPKTFFSKDDSSVASLIVRLDKVPDELKKFIVGQFELQVAEQRKKNGKNEEPAEKTFLDWLGDGLTGGLKTLLDDSKEFKVRLFVDEKSDELSAEVTLTAKQGSTLAKNFGTFAGKSSLPLAIVAGKAPVIRGSVKGGLTPDLKTRFAKVVDELSAHLIDMADANAKAVVRQGVEAFDATLKAAEVDVAFAVHGPDAKGRHTLIIAGAIKKGKEIEKLLKELALSAGGVADFDFDVEKIGDFSLHKITLSQDPLELENTFGSKTFWLAVSDSHFALSLEVEGTAIRAGLKSKPVVAPILSFEMSAAKMLPLLAKKLNLKPDEVKAILADAFGDGGSAGKDTITVTIESGEQLTVKAKLKGKAVRLFVALDQLKNK